MSSNSSFCVVLFIIGGVFLSNRSLVSLIEGTICAALAIILSYIKIKVGFLSISLGMIPMILYAIRRGWVKGMAAGLLWGVLHILVGRIEILTLFQGFIEYFLAYTFIGVAGVLSPIIATNIRRGNEKKANLLIVLSVLIGTLSRYIWHFIAGFLFFAAYAPEGMNPVVYSILVNGTNALATAVVTSIVLLFLNLKSKRLFIPDRVTYK